MSQHPTGVRAMTNEEIGIMRAAVKAAADRSEVSDVRVAPIVYRLYSQGMTDPGKLAAAAGMLATSRAFNEVKF